TPRPFMDLAQRVLRAAGREPQPLESIREGSPPLFVPLDQPAEVAAIAENLAADPDIGRVAVIAPRALAPALQAHLESALPQHLVGSGDQRLDTVVSVLTVAQAKGLEFDAVIVTEPGMIEAESPQPGSDLYVALTRATRDLVIAYSGALPAGMSTVAT
ncbi:MAG: ATP-binding domain-containing protein, partial [bacterium]